MVHYSLFKTAVCNDFSYIKSQRHKPRKESYTTGIRALEKWWIKPIYNDWGWVVNQKLFWNYDQCKLLFNDLY